MLRCVCTVCYAGVLIFRLYVTLTCEVQSFYFESLNSQIEREKMMRLSEIGKLKAFSSFLESLSCQLTQRCSASGTAKGKAKLKDGKPLKKNKIVTKKGVSSAPKGGPRITSESEALVDEVLLATAPVRFLTPKERARDVEREKMGLISKAREEEKKKLKKHQKTFSSPFIIGTPGLDLITLGVVDADKIPKYELTVEDGSWLAREYGKVLKLKSNESYGAETALIKLKKEAIEALPEHLRMHALSIDSSNFPGKKLMATVTPPIEGYIERVKEADKKAAEKIRLTKLR